jgi:hypothetical protein
MSQTLDFYIDVDSGIILPQGAVAAGVIPDLTRNDVYNFRARLLQKDAFGNLNDFDTTGIGVKFAIGDIDDGPSSGQFKLIFNGVTSNAITYSEDEITTALNIYTAVSNIVSTVTTYGLEADSYVLTATQSNTALSFSGDSFTLFPSSNVQISTRRNPATGVNAQQIVKLRKNPAVYSDSFITSPTLGNTSLVKTQSGSGSPDYKNTIYLLTIGNDALGGSFSLAFSGNSTTGIPFGALPSEITSLLNAVTAARPYYPSVDSANSTGQYTIRFGAPGDINDLTLDAGGLQYANFLQATVTMGTSELDELFADSGEDIITPILEIEVTESNKKRTVFQGEVNIRRDLIQVGNVVPGAQASYYTKSEANALFVEDSTSGTAGSIDAASFKLRDSSGNESVDWQNRKLFDGATEYVRWDNGLGFYGATAIAKPTGVNLINSVSSLGLLSYSTPTGNNVVSNLVSAGILSTSATYGVFPASIKTITTTVTLSFGTVNANDTTSVSTTVTGVSANDIVLLGLPTALSAGLAFYAHVSAADIVEVDAVNGTNTSRTQSPQTFRITAIGY